MNDRTSKFRLIGAGVLNFLPVLSYILPGHKNFDILPDVVFFPSLVMMALSITALAASAAVPRSSFPNNGLCHWIKSLAYLATLFTVLGHVVVLMSSDGSIGPGLLPLFGFFVHTGAAILLLIATLLDPRRGD